MRALSFGLIALCLASLAGCTAGDGSGEDEPFRVRNAQFFSGALPGFVPTGDSERTPRLTGIETANLAVRQGQGAKVFSGRAERDASSIAIVLDGVGTGYWVIPTGVVDAATGELTWTLSADFDLTIRPGAYTVRVVAIDETGQAGDQLLQPLCISGRVPDNGRACDDQREPPRAVISLQWDTNVDLDVQVVASDGSILDAKHPTGSGAESFTGATLDRDSNAACAIDGIRTENVVWNDAWPEGRYHVFANLFDACGAASVRFSVNLYSAESNEDGTADVLVRHLRRTGELLEMAVDPRATRGLFITEVSFQ